MASVNKVILVGNLGADPEVRHMPNGDAVANLRIATTESWKDKNTGEKKELTEWHRVSFFGKLAEICGQYLKKGAQVYVEGSIRTRKWTDNDGQERYTTDIRGDEMKMLGKRDGEQQQRSEQQAQKYDSNPPGRPGGYPAQHNSGGSFADFEDDIPFLNIGRGLSFHSI